MLTVFQSTIRIAMMVVVILVAVAIGLGRMTSFSEVRLPTDARLIGLSHNPGATEMTGLTMIDVGRGDLRSVSLSKGEIIDLASSSPWVNPWGESQVVGRWKRSTTNGLLGTSREFGMARVTYPGGRVIDRVPINNVAPISRPCWSDDARARVLFAGGDGALHCLDFEPEAGQGWDGDRAGPRKVRWRADRPGQGPPLILDVSRPVDPGLSELVLVSMAVRIEDGNEVHYEGTEIWWLRLSPDETEILDHGQITQPDPSGIESDRLHPTLVRRPDGRLVLAYLSRNPTRPRLDLRLIGVSQDPRTGVLVADAKVGRLLARDCQSVPPRFSDQGHRLTYVSLSNGRPQVRVLPIDMTPKTFFAAARMLPGF